MGVGAGSWHLQPQITTARASVIACVMEGTCHWSRHFVVAPLCFSRIRQRGPHNLKPVVSSASEESGGVQLLLDCLLIIIIQASLGVYQTLYQFLLFASRSSLKDPARPVPG